MKNKEKALQMLLERQSNPMITYEMISVETGYGRKQLGRLSAELKQKDMISILTHGNTGRKPATTASDQEVSYLRVMKESYPSITIAQFRDIFMEDVILNSEMQDIVNENDLKPRSASWFRQLFIREGWESPANKPVRRNESHVTHPIRKPRAHRGELVQIDGTPYDWFGDGRKYVLHLAVDDATSEALSGWFMPTECTRGYARMMRELLDRHGIPEALYSDKDAVFRSVKSGGPSQFAEMIETLKIEMIFANSAQAKGRIERYNGTAQNRLPNDIIRHHLPHDYDYLNRWFNDFYIKYLNRKFSFPPEDHRDAFKPILDEFDYGAIFRIHESRQIRRGHFSLGKVYYSAFTADGELLDLLDGTKVDVNIDALTDEIYIERYGKHYTCMKVGEKRRDELFEVDSQKQLNDLLNEQRWKK